MSDARRHVFVSHASAESDSARAWCAAVEADGLPCWIAPRDILPSADWAEQIIDGIEASWAMLLVLGEAANQSPQVRREVERAVSKGVPVLPLRIAAVPLSKSLEYFLSSQHWLDVSVGAVDAHRTAVVGALRALRQGESHQQMSEGARPAQAVPVWQTDWVAAVEQAMAQHLGPVASILVQRAVRQARSDDELFTMLSSELDNPVAQGELRRLMRAR